MILDLLFYKFVLTSQKTHQISRFSSPASVLHKIKLFWYVTPCRLNIYQSTRRNIPNNLQNSQETSIAVMSSLSAFTDKSFFVQKTSRVGAAHTCRSPLEGDMCWKFLNSKEMND